MSILVSIPDRDFGELQWQASETQTVFSFQGAVARVDHQYTIPAVAWEEGKEKKSPKPFCVRHFKVCADRNWGKRG